MFMSVDLPAPFSPRSACTSPRRTSNETSSFATTPGNSLRIPRISRTRSSVARSLIGPKTKRAGSKPALLRRVSVLVEHRRRLELAGDDLRLVAVHQLDPRRLDGRADLADADALVLQVEDEILATLEVALRGLHDGLEDAHSGLLDAAREDPLRDLVLVGVDADAPLPELRRLLQSGVATGARDLEDHLGTRTDLVLREVRARLDVSEAVRVLDERLRALDGLRGAVLVARDEGVDRRDLDAAHDADLLLAHGLGLLGGEHTDETRGLLRGVGDPFLVLEPADGCNPVVGDRELDVRVLRGERLDRVAKQEAGGDDELVAVVHSLLVVRLVVARRVRDVGIRDAVDRARSRLEALELILVESVVVEAGDVAHQRRLVTGLLRCGRLGAAERAADENRRSERGHACRNNPA